MSCASLRFGGDVGNSQVKVRVRKLPNERSSEISSFLRYIDVNLRNCSGIENGNVIILCISNHGRRGVYY